MKMKKIIILTSLFLGLNLLVSCSSETSEIIDEISKPTPGSPAPEVPTSTSEGLPSSYNWDEIFRKNNVSSRFSLPTTHDYYNGSTSKLRSIQVINNETYAFHEYYKVLENGFKEFSNTYTIVNGDFYYNSVRFKNISSNQHLAYKREDGIVTLKISRFENGFIEGKSEDRNFSVTAEDLTEDKMRSPIFNIYGNFSMDIEYDIIGDVTEVNYTIIAYNNIKLKAKYKNDISNQAPKGLGGLLGAKELQYPTEIEIEKRTSINSALKSKFIFNYSKDNAGRIRFCEINKVGDSDYSRKYIFFYD